MAKRQNDFFSLEDLMKEVIKENNLSKGLEKFTIQEAWANVMGNGVVSYTKEVKLMNDTLLVILKSSVLREELSYGKEKIIAMLNEVLPKPVIKKIILA